MFSIQGLAMKAVRVHEFGGPQVLKVEEDVPIPVHTDTQVLFIDFITKELFKTQVFCRF